MDEVLFQCRARGTTREGYRIRASLNWAFCRWADLLLTDTQLVFGDWTIPYEEIDDAVFVYVPVLVGAGWHGRLIVSARGQVYQFILPFQSIWTWEGRADPFWDGPLPFDVGRITQKLDATLLLWIVVGINSVWLLVTLLINLLR